MDHLTRATNSRLIECFEDYAVAGSPPGSNSYYLTYKLGEDRVESARQLRACLKQALVELDGI